MKRRTFNLLAILVSILAACSIAAYAAEPGTSASDVAERADQDPTDVWRSYTNGNYVNALAVEGNYLWAATQGGVVRWDRTDSTYTKYTAADGLADNRVNAIAVDGAGHKWFGTWGGGVSEFDGDTWTTHTTADGLANNLVFRVTIDGGGHKWFGTYGGGVSEFDGDTWTTYTTADGLANNEVLAITIDGTGQWFGTSGGVSEHFVVRSTIYLPIVGKNHE